MEQFNIQKRKEIKVNSPGSGHEVYLSDKICQKSCKFGADVKGLQIQRIARQI